MHETICATCGLHSGNGFSQDDCPLCRDERRHQVSGRTQWTDFDRMRKEGFRNILTEIETDLFEIVTAPSFATGQRAFLVRTGQGNLLWDCVSYLDAATVAVIKALGGLAAVAISHPHFYGAMLAWSEAFGSAPVWIAEADRQWIPRNADALRFYRSEADILPGIKVIRCGGHFPGSAVLHWAAGAEGKGVLLASDTLNVLPDRQRVGFMYSRPDLLPLPAGRVRSIIDRLSATEFERVYGGWQEENILAEAKKIFLSSADCFVRKAEGVDEAAWKATIL